MRSVLVQADSVCVLFYLAPLQDARSLRSNNVQARLFQVRDAVFAPGVNSCGVSSIPQLAIWDIICVSAWRVRTFPGSHQVRRNEAQRALRQRGLDSAPGRYTEKQAERGNVYGQARS
jgi:hypothetical protein